MVGIPDGLGAHRAQRGKRIVYMNHELTNTTLSEPVVGAPLNRGAFVSKLVVDRDGDVISGERAYDWVFNENTFHGPAAEVGNSTRPFSRFCSGLARDTGRARVRPPHLHHERGRGHAREHLRHDGRPGGRDRRQQPVHAPEARPVRLGEHARPADSGQPDGDHGHGGRPGRARSGPGEQPGLPVRRAKRIGATAQLSCAATASTTASCTCSLRRTPRSQARPSS